MLPPATWSTSRPTCSIRSSSRRRAKAARQARRQGRDAGRKEMKKLGMQRAARRRPGHASRQPRLVVMRWNGGKAARQPGRLHRQGRHLRHRRHLDQAGRRHGGHEGRHGRRRRVTGLMQALAARKAKANVVGIIGLVENMPDGNAQRPGDVVKSHVGPDHRGASTPTPRAGWCWPMPCGTARTASSRSSWSISRR